MLILDKRKAVERVMALTPAVRAAAGPEAPPARFRRRSAQRVATYERRSAPATIAPKRRRGRPSVDPSPA